MLSPSLSDRAPADAGAQNSRPNSSDVASKYITGFLAASKNAASHVAEVLFGCRHGNTAFPQRDRQICLDCGSWRSYLLGNPMCPGDTEIWRGPWQKPERPAPRGQNHGRRHGDMKSPAEVRLTQDECLAFEKLLEIDGPRRARDLNPPDGPCSALTTIARGRDYVAGEMPQTLKRFLDDETLSPETTRKEEALKEEHAQAGEETRPLGAYKEPWTVKVDLLGGLKVFDGAGVLVMMLAAATFFDYVRAERIVAAMNFCAGMTTAALEDTLPLADLTTRDPVLSAALFAHKCPATGSTFRCVGCGHRFISVGDRGGVRAGSGPSCDDCAVEAGTEKEGK